MVLYCGLLVGYERKGGFGDVRDNLAIAGFGSVCFCCIFEHFSSSTRYVDSCSVSSECLGGPMRVRKD